MNATDITSQVETILSLNMSPKERVDSAIGYMWSISDNTESRFEFEKNIIDRIIPYAEKNCSESVLSDIYDNLGRIQLYIGPNRKTDAKKSYFKALEYARKSRDRFQIALVLEHQAQCEVSYGELEKGFQLAEEAIKEFKGLGGQADNRIARCYYMQAVIYLSSGDLDGIKKLLGRMEAHLAAVGSEERPLVTYNLYSVKEAYFGTLAEETSGSQKKSAIDSLNAVTSATIRFIEANTMRQLSAYGINPTWNYYNRAVFFVNYNNLPPVDSVEYYIGKMLSVDHEGRTQHNMEAEISATILRSEMWMKHNDYSRAKDAINKTLEKIDSLPDVNNLIIDKIDLVKSLVDMAKQSGNYKEAVEYAEMQLDFERQRYSDERARVIKDLEIKYQTKETDLALSQSEARRNSTLMWLFAAVAIILTIAATFFVYASRQRRRRLQQYIEGLETERARMSRELHDGVCNDLLAIQTKMRHGEDAEQLIDTCRESVRRISHELMPPEFEYATIDEAVRYFIRKQQHEGKTVSYKSKVVGGEWNAVPQNIALEVYRIIQESVGNSLKHSGGDIINVDMKLNGDALSVAIIDNGHYTTDGKRGQGMKSMRHRANAIGAKIDITMSETDGSRIFLTVKI